MCMFHVHDAFAVCCVASACYTLRDLCVLYVQS